jgi:hypothetical protein
MYIPKDENKDGRSDAAAFIKSVHNGTASPANKQIDVGALTKMVEANRGRGVLRKDAPRDMSVVTKWLGNHLVKTAAQADPSGRSVDPGNVAMHVIRSIHKGVAVDEASVKAIAKRLRKGLPPNSDNGQNDDSTGDDGASLASTVQAAEPQVKAKAPALLPGTWQQSANIRAGDAPVDETLQAIKRALASPKAMLV